MRGGGSDDPGNDAEHALLRDHFLAIGRRHGLALLRRHIRDLRLIRATRAQRAADMRHAPDAVLIRHENKAVAIGKPVRRLEVVGKAFNEVHLPIAVLVPQQREISRLLLRDDDVVVGKHEQSPRMLEPGDERRGGKTLHHARRLPRIRNDQRPACRDRIALWRR